MFPGAVLAFLAILAISPLVLGALRRFQVLDQPSAWRVAADVDLAGTLAGYLAAPSWVGRLRLASSPAGA